MQCIQFVRNVHNEHKRPRNSSTAIEHNIDVKYKCYSIYFVTNAYKVTDLYQLSHVSHRTKIAIVVIVTKY